jgi:hypothetical protein
METNTETTPYIQPALTPPNKPKKTKRTILLIFSVVALIFLSALGIALLVKSKNLNHTNPALIKESNGYVEVPKNISYGQAQNPTKSVSKEIFDTISSKLKGGNDKPGVVINLVKDGKVIYSDHHESDNSQANILSGPIAKADTANKNTYEIADPPSSDFQAWTPEEKTSLQDTIAKAYALNLQVQGPPAFNDTVKIYKQQDARGYYSPWGDNNTKTIVVPDDNPAVLSHEMAHSFHSDYVMDNRAWEEGTAMTVESLYQQKYENGASGYTGEEYDALNNPLISTSNFYSDSFEQTTEGEPISETDHYSMGGYAISKLYTENPQGLMNFYQDYYSAYSNASGVWSQSDLFSTLCKDIPTIEGIGCQNWIAHNYILDDIQNTDVNLAYLGDTIFFWQRNSQITSDNTDKYANSKLTETIQTLDGTQVYSTNLTTDSNGEAKSDLMGMVPKADFYKVIIDGESPNGVLGHTETVRFIVNNKGEYNQCTGGNCIFIAYSEADPIKISGGTGPDLVNKGDYYIAENLAEDTKYTISQSDKTYETNFIRGLADFTNLVSDSSESPASSPVKVVWMTPSDPSLVSSGVKTNLVFDNDSVDYDQPYINACFEIDGSYNPNKVQLNGSDVYMNKGGGCINVDLNNGPNKLTVTVVDTDGNTITSTRTISKTGTKTGSYADLPNLTGDIDITNVDSQTVGITATVENYSKLIEKNVLYGITINGSYYNPNYNQSNSSVTAAFFNIPSLSPVFDSNNNYKPYIASALELKTSNYPLTTGLNKVCLIIDPLGNVTESNENDNMVCKNVFTAQ